MFAGGRKWHVGKKAKDPARNPTYLVCAEKRNLKCNATALLHPNGTIETRPGQRHADAIKNNLLVECQFLEKLYLKRIHSYASGESIYQDVIRDFPDLAASMPYSQVSGRMNDWMKFLNPPRQNTYVDVQRLTQSPQWSELVQYSGGSVQLSSITSIDRVTALVYGDPTLVQQIPGGTDYQLHMILSSSILPDIADTQVVLTVSLLYGGRNIKKRSFCSWIRQIIQNFQLIGHVRFA
ncbi:uncharacterized protein LOC122856365 [Aphidius gifuensis]|uniref:uncharacterized protein LOC122856365 n=1 Tax=Aphidius gifuensis TaxID=684658 RepID=UPI001CDD3BA2|nr:uncharacterized protein LOC122856365 [Aphidius gifuensis]